MPYEKLFEAAGVAKSREGWESQLDPEEAALLPDFERWLVEDDEKAETTAAAYRGYVAQALCRLHTGDGWKDLSTDIRSAVRAFIRYSAALAAFAPDASSPVDELDTDPDREEQ